jgi:hypothetical protein
MGRRIVLVGFLVVIPFGRGSLMQLALATLLSFLYMTIQVLASPYLRRHSNPELAAVRPD